MKTKKTTIQSYYSLCLRAEIPLAIEELRRAKKNEKEARFARRAHRRFVTKEERRRVKVDDLFVKKVILTYRNYYRESLLDLGNLKKHEANHQAQIRSIAKWFNIADPPKKWDALENIVKREFHRRGYHCLLGRVSPLRSLMVWKRQTKKKFRIKLVESTQRLSVIFLHEFVELGWLHYATFGKYYVAGWAKRDALYCVAQAYRYKFKSDKFKASYLAHEAQHCADYKKFPKLKQTDLEYRAKLAELVAYFRPQHRIEFFRAEAKNDPHVPHCFAAYHLIKNLNTVDGSLPVSQVASLLLKAHTAKIVKAGTKTVTSVLKKV